MDFGSCSSGAVNMNPMILHALSKTLYNRLKEDPFLQKNITGIFTHAPGSIQGAYLIYHIEPFKLLTPLESISSPPHTFNNRALGVLKVSGISEEGNSVIPFMQQVAHLLDHQSLPLKEQETLVGYSRFHHIFHKTTENSLPKKRSITMVFENYLRF
jgi:hypothetical protein